MPTTVVASAPSNTGEPELPGRMPAQSLDVAASQIHSHSTSRVAVPAGARRATQHPGGVVEAGDRDPDRPDRRPGGRRRGEAVGGEVGELGPGRRELQHGDVGAAHRGVADAAHGDVAMGGWRVGEAAERDPTLGTDAVADHRLGVEDADAVAVRHRVRRAVGRAGVEEERRARRAVPVELADATERLAAAIGVRQRRARHRGIIRGRNGRRAGRRPVVGARRQHRQDDDGNRDGAAHGQARANVSSINPTSGPSG